MYEGKGTRFKICDYDGVKKKKKTDKYFIRKNKMTYIKISPYDVLSYWLALKHYDVLRYCRKSHLLLIQLNEKSL